MLDPSKFLHWDALDFLTDGEVVGTGSQGIIYTATWNGSFRDLLQKMRNKKLPFMVLTVAFLTGKKVAVKIGPDVSILQEHITVRYGDHLFCVFAVCGKF
jgi:hypothetical protein